MIWPYEAFHEEDEDRVREILGGEFLNVLHQLRAYDLGEINTRRALDILSQSVQDERGIDPGTNVGRAREEAEELAHPVRVEQAKPRV